VTGDLNPAAFRLLSQLPVRTHLRREVAPAVRKDGDTRPREVIVGGVKFASCTALIAQSAAGCSTAQPGA